VLLSLVMTENRKLSVPADNPEYFNLADWEGIGGDGSSQAETNQAILNNLGDLEPPREVFDSLVSIEKLTEKNNAKTKKKKLGSSLKRLFSSNNRRNSGSGLENEYLPTPSSPNDTFKAFGSLPSTPTKTPQNPFFRHSSESKSLKSTLSRQVSNPMTPTTPDNSTNNPSSKFYYNTQENKASGSAKPKSAKTPVKSSKPPPGPNKSNTPRKTSVTSPMKSGGMLSRVRTRSTCSTGREGVPGMEAPPLPVLHSVCRGFVEGEMPSIVILYSGGCNASRRWRDYLAKVLEMRDSEKDKGKVFGQRVEEFSETGGLAIREEGRRCEEVVYHCPLVLVIISNKFTTWLDKTGIMLGKILHPSRVVGLMLGVSHSDITPAITTSLQHFPGWRVVEIKEGGGENSDFTIGQYCQEILATHDENTTLPEEPKFKVFPRKISPGQTKVQVIMDGSIDQMDREQFELFITLDDRKYSIEEAKWIKDDLVQVEVPASLFQSTLIATLVLKLNGKNYGSRQLKLENAATILESAWQVCTDPVTILSDAFDVRFVNSQDIDEFLSASLEKKLSISDLLNTRYKGETKEDSFVRDHSNLIHFSAKHGFTRVCQTLLSLGYQKYLSVPNILGLTPPECAEKSGYHPLAQELRGRLPPQHEYQYPSVGCVEGEDGYLMPCQSTADQQVPDLDYQNVIHDYQVPATPLPPKYADLFPPKLIPIQEKFPECDSKPVSPRFSSEDFYQVPPTPIPLVLAPGISKVSPSSSSPSDSSISIPTPPSNRLSAASYLPMVPPLQKKAMSEPRPSPHFPIPKSGSFSHFTNSYSEKVLAQGPIPPKAAMSREELIKTFCQDIQVRPDSTPPSLLPEDLDPPAPVGTPPNYNPPPRPDSTPPNIDYYQNHSSAAALSPSIGIPPRRDTFSSLQGRGTARVQLLEREGGKEGSPFDHHVHTDTGLVYLPIDNQDSDSELTSYFEAGKISEQSLQSYRKNSVSPDVDDPMGVKHKNNFLRVDGEVGKVKKMLGRLSPARPKFSMGSLRRKAGSRTGPHCDDNENIIDSVESSDKMLLSVEDLKDSVLNLSNSRCSSLKNVSTPLPPKISLHSNTLPSPDKKNKANVSSSLYDIPRHLSKSSNKVNSLVSMNNNTGDYIMAEIPSKRVEIVSQDSDLSQINGARNHSVSSPVKNSNEGAYENVKIIPIEKEK